MATENKFNFAGALTKECIDDHVAIVPETRPLGPEHETEEIKYDIFHRYDFTVAFIPSVNYTNPPGVSILEDGADVMRAGSSTNRGWNVNTIAKELKKEEAIRIAKDYGRRENIPVSLRGNAPFDIEIIQKPEGWEPKFG